MSKDEAGEAERKKARADKLGADLAKAGQSITQIGCGCIVLVLIALVAWALISAI